MDLIDKEVGYVNAYRSGVNLWNGFSSDRLILISFSLILNNKREKTEEQKSQYVVLKSSYL